MTYNPRRWTVLFDDDFRAEFRTFDEPVRLAIASYAKALETEGPDLKRPWADTLRGSVYSNMRELRPTVNKVEWRVAYAFDEDRQAIVLAAGAKGGIKEERFYEQLIRKADRRFTAHLERTKKTETRK